MKLRVAVWLVLASLAVAPRALAQVPAYDLERLQLDPSAKGSLVIGDGEVGPQWSTRFSVGAHWEHQPLVFTTDNKFRGRGVGAAGDIATNGNVVKDRTTLHLGASVAVLDSLELYLRVPYVLTQKSDFVGAAKPDSNGIGTPSAGFRWGIVSQAEGAPVSVAFGADFYPAWGTQKAVAGNPKESFAASPRIEIGHRYSRFVVGAQAWGLFRESTVVLGTESMDAEFGAGLALATTGRLRGELSFRGTVNQNDVGKHFEALAGARYSAGPVELFALGGPGFQSAPGTPQWRALVGLALDTQPKKAPPPPPPDPCAAGKVHTPEQCPNLDDDGDGILNKDDACPTVPGIPELKGCPAKDSDGDGIPDHLDRCPNEPGIPELQGCPAKDTDGDGIPDHLDKCPTEPGIAELQGCPAKDSDGDGVPDHLDKCPDVPGTAEFQGCPPPKAQLKQGKIDIKEAVYFDTGKATIQDRSNALLDEVAQILKDNPQVTKVVVEGHTDSAGKAASNRKLSAARAEAVKAYLVGKGVDAGRLDTKGFGPDKPVASNKTKDGREKNRRVEFTVTGVNQ